MFNLKVIPFGTFEVIIVEGALTSSVLMVTWVITKRFYIVTFYKKPHLLIKYVIKSIKNHWMFPPIYCMLPSRTFVRSSTSIDNSMHLNSFLGADAVCIFANYNDIHKSSCLDQSNVDRYSSWYFLGIHIFQHVLQSWRSD